MSMDDIQDRLRRAREPQQQPALPPMRVFRVRHSVYDPQSASPEVNGRGWDDAYVECMTVMHDEAGTLTFVIYRILPDGILPQIVRGFAAGRWHDFEEQQALRDNNITVSPRLN